MSLPEKLRPMLARAVPEPFDSKEFLFEIKWDGIRCLAFLNPQRGLKLQSRNLLDITKKFPELTEIANSCPKKEIIFDGELIVLDSDSRPVFSHIQRRVRQSSPTVIKAEAATTPATYMIFDLLYFDDKELFALPLTARKELLSSVLSESNYWFLTRSIREFGKEYAKIVFSQGFEGIVAKKTSSQYYPGKRSSEWLKIINRQELIAKIVGFIAPSKAAEVDSLLLAREIQGSLVYLGRVGTGFDTVERKKLLQILAQELSPTPIVPIPSSSDLIWWVKPKYSCKIKYLEFTKDGILRHPVYKGLVYDER